ncbi:MAG: glycosyltransferase family 2 protein, partial [Verrucomicrobiota bacterium]|nr:glycosyltransferase family 2 protein [Verrucomicrobiota bacterium]
AVIIPACHEEACIAAVLEELLAAIDPREYTVAVGVNSSSDRTAEIARRYPVVVAETAARGYGHGCQAAIDAVTEAVPTVAAFIFFAGDGATDPRDIPRLTAAYDRGAALVLGVRTRSRQNWRSMGLSHVIANVLLASWAGLLGGRRFADLAAFRLIERRLFEAIQPIETTFGWTIETQVAAAMLGVCIKEVPAGERRRLAGEQKVSGVTWRRTVAIGCRIVAAGWRTHLRFAPSAKPATAEMLPVPDSGGSL